MARRVFLHIGLPKTGTTYLQSVLWDNHEQLEAGGVLLPGRGHRDHLWAALDVQGRKDLARRHPDAPGTWGRLCDELAGTRGDGLVSHEFFCGASRERATQAVSDLAPAEVHVVITARHMVGMRTAGWQEMVKNGGTAGPDETPRSKGPGSNFSLRTWDLDGVLKRWGEVVPPEQVHVLPVPQQGAPPDRHWLNFAQVVGIRGDYRLPSDRANTSLGLVQVELLRRVNSHLTDFTSARDRGQWIRGYLGEGLLAAQEGTSFGLGAEVVADCRQRSERAVQRIRERGFDVVGDVESLLVPDPLPLERAWNSVSDAELLEAASQLIADMVSDVRELSVSTHQAAARRGRPARRSPR